MLGLVKNRIVIRYLQEITPLFHPIKCCVENLNTDFFLKTSKSQSLIWKIHSYIWNKLFLTFFFFNFFDDKSSCYILSKLSTKTKSNQLQLRQPSTSLAGAAAQLWSGIRHLELCLKAPECWLSWAWGQLSAVLPHDGHWGSIA